MGRGRPRKPVVLSPQVREELTALSQSRTACQHRFDERRGARTVSLPIGYS